MDEIGITQQLVWPVELARQEGGSILVSFPDVPEALTEGETEAEALESAQDCLVAALGGYISAQRGIPRPSPVCGRAVVPLPALAAAKIALYGAMCAAGIGNAALAVRLGISEGAVRRLIDLDHCLHIGQVETGVAHSRADVSRLRQKQLRFSVIAALKLRMDSTGTYPWPP